MQVQKAPASDSSSGSDSSSDDSSSEDEAPPKLTSLAKANGTVRKIGPPSQLFLGSLSSLFVLHSAQTR
jgi:hypothetical protein